MKNKTIGFILQLPLVLIVIAGFFGSIYAVIYGVGNISIFTPILFAIVIILYIIGKYFENKSDKWRF
jgi:hypothetical protein